MIDHVLLSHFAGLPRNDRTLLRGFVAAALLALGLGIAFGAGTALARAGFLPLSALAGYRLMSLHGATIFFYWLYFAQAALLLVFTVTYTEAAEHVAWRGLAWAGLAAMFSGMLLNVISAASGQPLLYDAPPELAGVPTLEVAAFYLGYLLLGGGLLCVATAAVATALTPKVNGEPAELSAVGFACVAWAGLLMVSAVAAVNAFLPAAYWALGFGPQPENYSTGWHVLFHNMHYLPLMATVLVWYVLVDMACGVRSIFGARFSKVVFALYLVFVPPTSLYHMFLEPNLAAPVRVAGSLLSLFISVPTVLAFLIIIASLEAHVRAHGKGGLFGWLRALPWSNPAIAAIGAAVINLALGGSLSFVLIQEKLAPLLSDTFFVPGYFHFLTVGTVTLTFLAAFVYVVPLLFGGSLGSVRLLAVLPWVITGGLVLFGGAGIAAGYSGLPRRVLDVTYGMTAPGSWPALMAVLGVGATIMALALLAYLLVLIRAMIPAAAGGRLPEAAVTQVAWRGVEPAGQPAWTGLLSVAVLIATMALFTVVAFELIQALPLVATGGEGH